MSLVEILITITAVFGVIGGVYAFWGWMRRTVFAPRLRLTYDQARTGDIARDFLSKTKFVFYHVQATNGSRTMIRRAHAYVLDAQKIDTDGRLVPWTDFRSKLPLPWANSGGRLDIELFSNESARIDFLTLPVDQEFLAFSTPQGPSGTAIAIPEGVYVFHVVCTAENAKMGELHIKVDFSDSKTRPKIERYVEKTVP